MGQGFGRAFEAIADPIRLRIVRHLSAHGAATIVELAAAAGVHANTARTHVAGLERAGMLSRVAALSRGRGRPQLRFRLHENAPPFELDPHALAGVLAAAAGPPRGARAAARLRSLGAAWARQRQGVDVVEALERLGFRARMEEHRVQLGACPCPLVAPDHPETVCQLARGAAAGLLAASGREVRSAQHDPEARRCTLVLG
jgi:predicted ArsR family transcriptional regulator